MVMQGPLPGAFLASQANGGRSIDTLVATGDIGVNAVIGKASTATTTYSAAKTADSTGMNAVFNVDVGTSATPTVGDYVIDYVDDSMIPTLSITDPGGNSSTVEHGGFRVELEDIAFDFSPGDGAAGDTWTITVSSSTTAGSGEIKAWDPGASDGSEVPHGIAMNAASAGEKFGAVVRDAVVIGDELQLPSGATLDQVRDGLEARGIIVR